MYYAINNETKEVGCFTSFGIYEACRNGWTATTIWNLYQTRGIPASHIHPQVGNLRNEYGSTYGRLFCFGIVGKYQTNILLALEYLEEATNIEEEASEMSDVYNQTKRITIERLFANEDELLEIFDWVYALKNGCKVVESW